MAFSKMLPAPGHEAWQPGKDTELWFMGSNGSRPQCSNDRYFSTLGTEKLLETERIYKGKTDFILIKVETDCCL